MNRAIRILTGGWLSTAMSHFTRGWYEGALAPPPGVVIPTARVYNVFFEDRAREISFENRAREIDFEDRTHEARPE